jgi:hypothetical protein
MDVLAAAGSNVGLSIAITVTGCGVVALQPLTYSYFQVNPLNPPDVQAVGAPILAPGGPEGIPHTDKVAQDAVGLNPEPVTSRRSGAVAESTLIFGFKVALQPAKKPIDMNASSGDDLIELLCQCCIPRSKKGSCTLGKS